MPHTPLGESSAGYEKTTILHLAYYECQLADSQSCVDHLYHKDLGDGRLAVFGSYCIFLLFVRKKPGRKTLCFHMKISQSFCVLLENGISDADGADVSFSPDVTAKPGLHAIDWEIDVHGRVHAAFFRKNGSDDELPAPPLPDGERVSDDEKAPEVPAREVLQVEKVETADTPGEHWQIRKGLGISAEELLNMDDKNRRRYREPDT